VKKANKWACKVCGEKQSYQKVYGQGTGKDCRLHVQKLNAMAADLEKGEEENENEEEQRDVSQEVHNDYRRYHKDFQEYCGSRNSHKLHDSRGSQNSRQFQDGRGFQNDFGFQNGCNFDDFDNEDDYWPDDETVGIPKNGAPSGSSGRWQGDDRNNDERSNTDRQNDNGVPDGTKNETLGLSKQNRWPKYLEDEPKIETGRCCGTSGDEKSLNSNIENRFPDCLKTERFNAYSGDQRLPDKLSMSDSSKYDSQSSRYQASNQRKRQLDPSWSNSNRFSSLQKGESQTNLHQPKNSKWAKYVDAEKTLKSSSCINTNMNALTKQSYPDSTGSNCNSAGSLKRNKLEIFPQVSDEDLESLFNDFD